MERKLHFIEEDDPRETRTAYQLRHTIFCKKLGIHPLSENGLEIDEYDSNCKHVLVSEDNKYVGVGRVILPPNLAFKNLIKVFPEYEYLRHEHDLCEFSRFGSVGRGALEMLMAGMMIIAYLEQYTKFVCIIEPRLARHMAKLGGTLIPIGDEQELDGKRIPYMGWMATNLQSLAEKNKPLYRLIFNEVMNEREKS